jgi:hypothetical protein
VLEISQDQGLYKVMVDATRLNKMPSITYLHDFAIELASKTMKFKHALVVSEQTPHDISHIEIAAQNRGATIKIFTSKDDALLWLSNIS